MTKKVELTNGIILLIVGILFFGFQTDQTKQNKESVFDGYPVPTDKNMLFYIQKSFNTNAVVYTASWVCHKSIRPF